MASPEVPHEVSEDNTNVGGIPVNRAHLHSWVRIFLIVAVLTLFVSDIVMYSLLQASQAQLDNLDRKVHRLDQLVLESLTATQDPERLEKIQQRISGIESSVADLKGCIAEPEKP